MWLAILDSERAWPSSPRSSAVGDVATLEALQGEPGPSYKQWRVEVIKLYKTIKSLITRSSISDYSWSLRSENFERSGFFIFLVALPVKRTLATVRALGFDKRLSLSWSLPACWKHFEYHFNEFSFSPSKKCLKEYRLSSLSQETSETRQSHDIAKCTSNGPATWHRGCHDAMTSKSFPALQSHGRKLLPGPEGNYIYNIRCATSKIHGFLMISSHSNNIPMLVCLQL